MWLVPLGVVEPVGTVHRELQCLLRGRLLVRRIVEDLGLLDLHERRGLGRLVVELLERPKRMRDSRLRLRRVLHRRRVLDLLCLTDIRGLRNCGSGAGDLLGELRDLLRELGDGDCKLVDVYLRNLDGLSLLSTFQWPSLRRMGPSVPPPGELP